MTAEQIIREIQALPREEQASVVRFVYELDAERQLSAPELAALAERMVASEDETEALVLREQIIRGFYGRKRDA